MSISSFLLTNFFNGVLAVLMLVFAYKLFDFFTPSWDFKDAFKEPFITNGGIVIAAFLIGVSVVVGLTAG